MLGACAPLWPTAKTPLLDAPPPAQIAQTIDRQWWSVFGTPELNDLVAEAIANNLDLAKAAARVQEARANAGVAEAALVPRVDAIGKSAFSRRQLNGIVRDTDFDRSTTTNSLGLAASWEIDLWGRIAQTNDAARARLAASTHTRNAVELSISSAVVDAYFQLRLFDAKLDITRQAAINLKEATDLEYRRWKAEAGTELAEVITVRSVFVIGPDNKVKLSLTYPASTGRNFDEVLRVIDSLQLTAKHRVATPVNWKQGEKVIIAGSVSDDEAKTIYPNGWDAPRPYLRIVPQPQ